MNIQKFFLLMIGAFCSLLFQSCQDDDLDENNCYYNALVTVKQANDKSVFLQLDNRTTLFPVNLKYSPFGSKEVRALVNYKEINQSDNGCTKSVYVNWIDSLLTKQMSPDLGIKNDSAYGHDPVEIITDRLTIAEDGYLTLHIRTIWGDQRKVHYVNLVSGGNPDNPYEVEFRHNACGDTNGKMIDALVAFKLDKIPDTEGKIVKLKLKWKSFNKEESVEFNLLVSGKRALTPILKDFDSERAPL